MLMGTVAGEQNRSNRVVLHQISSIKTTYIYIYTLLTIIVTDNVSPVIGQTDVDIRYGRGRRRPMVHARIPCRTVKNDATARSSRVSVVYRFIVLLTIST